MRQHLLVTDFGTAKLQEIVDTCQTNPNLPGGNPDGTQSRLPVACCCCWSVASPAWAPLAASRSDKGGYLAQRAGSPAHCVHVRPEPGPVADPLIAIGARKNPSFQKRSSGAQVRAHSNASHRTHIKLAPAHGNVEG